MNAPELWQRPRPADAPDAFNARVEALVADLSAIGRRHARSALASSLSAEDNVLAHALSTAAPTIEVFVIDTGRLHDETLALFGTVERTLGVPHRRVEPDADAVALHVATHGAFAFYDSVAQRHACCALRKVEPLKRALAGYDAWLTGQRRVHGPERAALAAVEHDAAHGLAKYNPLAAWTDDDVWYYVAQHRLPVNPLHDRGYPSIGCEPCTRAIRRGEEPRAGRWWWEQAASKECGLHVAANLVEQSERT
jgi:phosphoadenosine phosphosulfate reductase